MNIYLSLFTKVKRGFISFYKHFNPSLEKKIITHQQTVKINCKYGIPSVKLYQIEKNAVRAGFITTLMLQIALNKKKSYQRYGS